jgi:hypothetical protein
VRAVVRILAAVLAVLLVAPIASAAASKPSQPLLLKVKWRRLVFRSGEPGGMVPATDRYVAFFDWATPGPLLLIDEQTGRRKQLSGPDCANPFAIAFGGPWLLVTCPGTPLVPATYPYQLYNLTNGQWTPFQVSPQFQASPQCTGDCVPVAVGRYWVKMVTDEGILERPPADYYLQNIATGRFEPDPATPGGTVFDDLSAPSGAAPLCPPLRYPSVYPYDYGAYLGAVMFYGPFAWTFGQKLQGPGNPGNQTWRLRRCRSNLNLVIGDTSNPSGTKPVASSRAVVMTRDGITLHGWFLPSLRRFAIRTALRDYVDPVAVTDRTIYIRTANYGQLWAATLPSPHTERH